jgi:hypothetical protein
MNQASPFNNNPFYRENIYFFMKKNWAKFQETNLNFIGATFGV